MTHPRQSPYLQANLDAHRRRWQTAPPCDRVETLDDAAWIGLHGARPLEEAGRWLEQASAGRPVPGTVCVIGAGLGWVVDLLVEQPASRVLVLEPEPALLPWFLARRDWREPIENGRLQVLAGPAFDGAQAAWRMFGDGSADPLVLAHPVLGRLQPEITRAAARVIGRARQGARGNEEARRKFAVPYLLNTLRNVPAITRAASVDALAGRHRGRPVVLAAAGPSLNRNIEELRPYRDGVVLLAVDTALKPLLAGGMPPDVVVALDPGDANGRHLAGVVVPASTALVAEPSIVTGSFDAFGGRVFVFRVAEHDPWPWLRTLGIDCGTLRAWGSVVTSALDLACRMGGDPVICIGADLAYTGGQPYARGTTYEEDWRATAGPARPVEWVWQQVVASRGVPARDIGDRPTRSAKGLMAFRDWLVEQSTREAMPRLVNATGAGILLGGRWEQRPLADLRLPARAGSVGPGDPPPPARRETGSDRAGAHPFDRHILDVLMQQRDAPAPSPSAHVMPYRGVARRDRIIATEVLRSGRGSDVDRWREPANLDPAWERRAVVAGRLVPPGTRVLDLGAGAEALARHIPADCAYTPADLVRRSPRTVVVDVNRGALPDGAFDVVAALGLLEYVHDPGALLARIRQRAALVVTSYCDRTTDDPGPRLERGFVNDFTRDEFVRLCQGAGWQVVFADRLDVGPGFDQWLFALRP